MRVWSGSTDLSFGGETYLPIAARRVSDIVLDGEPPEVTIRLPVLPSARAAWLAWDGSVPGIFHYVYVDSAGDWVQLGPRLVGRVTDPQFAHEDGVEVVDVTLRTAPERREPEYPTWSPEAQRARFPDDIGFDLMRESVTIRSRWPN